MYMHNYTPFTLSIDLVFRERDVPVIKDDADIQRNLSQILVRRPLYEQCAIAPKYKKKDFFLERHAWRTKQRDKRTH